MEVFIILDKNLYSWNYILRKKKYTLVVDSCNSGHGGRGKKIESLILAASTESDTVLKAQTN